MKYRLTLAEGQYSEFASKKKEREAVEKMKAGKKFAHRFLVGERTAYATDGKGRILPVFMRIESKPMGGAVIAVMSDEFAPARAMSIVRFIADLGGAGMSPIADPSDALREELKQAREEIAKLRQMAVHEDRLKAALDAIPPKTDAALKMAKFLGEDYGFVKCPRYKTDEKGRIAAEFGVRKTVSPREAADLEDAILEYNEAVRGER